MKALILFALAVILALWLTEAGAQTIRCLDRTALTTALKNDYHEAQRGLGVSPGGVIELWTSADGRTFTLILSLPNAVSCQLGAGENWQTVPARGERM